MVQKNTKTDALLLLLFDPVLRIANTIYCELTNNRASKVVKYKIQNCLFSNTHCIVN